LRDQDSYPYKTGKIIILFILVFRFLDGTLKLLNSMVTLNKGNAANFLVNLILICYSLVPRYLNFYIFLRDLLRILIFFLCCCDETYLILPSFLNKHVFISS
jgi:hypothetical protein